jgi:ABC-type multidrug transport system fused ATPase/permease subunit
MYSCPTDHWCSESTVEPFECDPMSMGCGEEGAYYEINFINFFIGIATAFLTVFASILYIRRQRRKNEQSRKMDTESAKVQLKNTVKEKETTSAIEIAFRNIEFSFPNSPKVVLPSVSGKIPAAQMTLLLGPSSR